MKQVRRSNCPISFALDIFGDKWSLLILRDLIFKDKRHYQEFAASDEEISTNILADRLQKLESNGIIDKEKDPDNGKQYIYSPTAKGLALVPMLTEMIIWSSDFDKKTGVPKEVKKRLARDKEGFIKNTLAKFHKE